MRKKDCNKKDHSPSRKYFPLSPTNSNSCSRGKFTTHSTLPSYLLITKMKFTEGTSQLHPQISSIMRNITKLKRSFITKELCPDGSTLSNGKATLPKKTLGFLKQSFPLPRNSSKTIKTPFAFPIPQSPTKQLSCPPPNNKHVFPSSPHCTPLHPIRYPYLYPKCCC